MLINTWHKKDISSVNLNPVLKSMANDKKSFKNGVPMLFGNEFAKLATERVDLLKAVSKFSKPEQKKTNHFRIPPLNSSTDGCRGGNKSGQEWFHPYSKTATIDQAKKPKQPRRGTVEKQLKIVCTCLDTYIEHTILCAE